MYEDDEEEALWNLPIAFERGFKSNRMNPQRTSNNLGRQGPDKTDAEELRFMHAGRTQDGRLYDVVVKVVDGTGTYLANQLNASKNDEFAATPNHLKLGQGTAHINLHRQAGSSGKNTFEFRLEDSKQPGQLLKVDDTFSFWMNFLDLESNVKDGSQMQMGYLHSLFSMQRYVIITVHPSMWGSAV